MPSIFGQPIEWFDMIAFVGLTRIQYMIMLDICSVSSDSGKARYSKRTVLY